VSVGEVVPGDGGFERTTAHDLAAEQCVLGGMLMSKDAISDVMEVIRPADHYRPAHQLVHEAILELYGRGEPADPVTVSDLLAKRGELARVGGGAYLHTLIASVPTAANAGYYARIVRERAILRRLVEVGTRIVQLGYAGDGDADELVDRAQAEIYGVTERRKQGQRLAGVSAWRIANLAAVLAGRKRPDARDEWREHLTGLPAWRKVGAALGFMVAAIRYRLQDAADLAWIPVDAVLKSRPLSNLVVGVPTVTAAVILFRHDGIDGVIASWESIAAISGSLYALIHIGRWWRDLKPPAPKVRRASE
jgi:hypothetical protein